MMEDRSLEPLYVEQIFRPKTYDIDFAGHVSNIVYIRWLEDLRMAILDAYLPLATLMEKGIAPVVIHTSIDYRKAVRLFDTVKGVMWGSSMESVKGILSAEFSVNETIVASAVQTGLFVRLQGGRPVPFPEEFRRHFEHRKKASASMNLGG
ncbi:MAG TPA: thioesterase family protein [Bacteroidota bacterium]|nr:thioesterase family protein [Bacteroidota bacterium]